MALTSKRIEAWKSFYFFIFFFVFLIPLRNLLKFSSQFGPLQIEPNPRPAHAWVVLYNTVWDGVEHIEPKPRPARV